MSVGAPDAVAGHRAGRPVCLVVASGGVAMAWRVGDAVESRYDAVDDISQALSDVESGGPRWVWWSARATASPLVASGVRPRLCWDLAAVHRLLHGTSRDDPAAIWAAHRDLPEPPPALPVRDPRAETLLFDADVDDDASGGPLTSTGELDPQWGRGDWADDLDRARRWAELAFDVYVGQHAAVSALPDPRPAVDSRPSSLRLLTAYAESTAVMLAAELEHDGLPLDRDVAGDLLGAVIGTRPVDDRHAAAQRRARDDAVLGEFPGEPVDLRNAALVRELL